MLKGKTVFLRPVEKEDAPKLMLWENNPKHWKVTGTEVPYSLSAIYDYIDQAQHIRSHGQLRLMIGVISTGELIGAIDLYNADFKHYRAAVGILIADELHKQKGFASEALELLSNYAQEFLAFHNLYCSIQSDNESSIRLFEKMGYDHIGTRKDWYLVNGKWLNELLYQKCLKKD